MGKRNIWLQPEQVELVILCLKFTAADLNDALAGGAHKKVSGPFTYARIQELIALFEAKP